MNRNATQYLEKRLTSAFADVWKQVIERCGECVYPSCIELSICTRENTPHNRECDLLPRIATLNIGTKVDIECDSSEFHSSKNAMKNDRMRDRMFLKHGINTLRFMYEELHSQAQSCVIEWLEYLIRTHVSRVYAAIVNGANRQLLGGSLDHPSLKLEVAAAVYRRDVFNSGCFIGLPPSTTECITYDDRKEALVSIDWWMSVHEFLTGKSPITKINLIVTRDLDIMRGNRYFPSEASDDFMQAVVMLAHDALGAQSPLATISDKEMREYAERYGIELPSLVLVN